MNTFSISQLCEGLSGELSSLRRVATVTIREESTPTEGITVEVAPHNPAAAPMALDLSDDDSTMALGFGQRSYIELQAADFADPAECLAFLEGFIKAVRDGLVVERIWTTDDGHVARSEGIVGQGAEAVTNVRHGARGRFKAKRKAEISYAPYD